MSTLISVHDKKAFLKWFLKAYNLKKRECTWILKYLVHREKHLEHIHFVRDVEFCPRAITMSTQCSDNLPFRFYKQSIVTDNVEKAFHDIRLYHEEPLYIQLNFPNAHQCPFYAFVLEENPYTRHDLFLSREERNYGYQILNDSIYHYRVKTLKKAIDQALDQQDKTAFLNLSEQLKAIEMKQQTFKTP